MDDRLTVEQSKEVFANLGLAVHASNVLEYASLHALFTVEMVSKMRSFSSAAAWEAAYDKFFDEGFSMPFGVIVKRIKATSEFSSELLDLLDTCKVVRNNLVHHFQRDHAEQIYSEEGRSTLISSYENAVAIFDVANNLLEDEVRELQVKFGVDVDKLSLRIEDEMQKLARSVPT
ncbi:MAG: hypothetical protein ABL928_11295 [Sphingorhabdus sp.]